MRRFYLFNALHPGVMLEQNMNADNLEFLSKEASVEMPVADLEHWRDTTCTYQQFELNSNKKLICLDL